jgi:hypothetical protein
MGTTKTLRGFEAGPASGATATEYALRVVSVTGAAGFAAAFPVYSQPCVFSTALLRSGGSTSDFAYLLLLFLRSFLGFSLLRHH